jgi:hypothetical protein
VLEEIEKQSQHLVQSQPRLSHPQGRPDGTHSGLPERIPCQPRGVP